MHSSIVQPLAAGPGPLLAVASGTFSYLAWIVLCGTIGLVAVIRVLRQPANEWRHRNWSKLAWVAAILYVAPLLGGYPIPIGAMAAIWRTRRRVSPETPSQIPRAQGSPDWPFPWGNR